MAETLFNVVFLTAAPFWGLMIVFPGWKWTRRIVGSPLIAAPAAAIYAVLAIPRIAELWAPLASPGIGNIGELLAQPTGTALAWAHFIAFDLFAGRWMYLDSRERGVHGLVMAPILFLTIMFGPLGLLAYLAVRYLPFWKPRQVS